MGKKTNRVQNFFANELWEDEKWQRTRPLQLLIGFLRVMFLAGKNFYFEHFCLLRASALTYTTVLSIVPLLACAFSVSKGFKIQHNLQPYLLKLAAGQESIVNSLIEYIDKTDVTSLGIIGLLVLFYTVVSVMSNIEMSFNHIWGVRKSRGFFERFAYYLLVVILGPVVLVAVSTMNTMLVSSNIMQRLMTIQTFNVVIYLGLKLLPLIMLGLIFTLIYSKMPNTRVRLKPALIAGFTAGIIWQLCQWCYIHFQVGMAKNNAIYGTFAAVPVFMVWVYFSWVIVLFGAELSFAIQNVRTYIEEGRVIHTSFGLKEEVAWRIMASASSRFYAGETLITAATLSEEMRLPVRLVREVLDLMVRARLMAEVVNPEEGYIPARDLSMLRLHDVLEDLRQVGEYCYQAIPDPLGDRLASVRQTMLKALARLPENVTWRELVTAEQKARG